jgi:adenine-specific DNA methylase
MAIILHGGWLMPAVADTEPSSTSPHHENVVWRPVQYLGSKLRAIDAITGIAADLAEFGGFWDAFSGTSVVGQAAADAGFAVFATDTQRSSASFATALLGIDAHTDEVNSFEAMISDLLQAEHPDEARWEISRQIEASFLANCDYDGLVEFYGQLPQRWRNGGAWSENTPLTTTFAGTYLSLAQAMALDAARSRLECLYQGNEASHWSYAAALTALCHAASEAVHSAGKHFAQPIQPAAVGSANYRFVRNRSFRDRSVSIQAKAADAAAAIVARSNNTRTHSARVADVLALSTDDLLDRGVSVVYADPPYTAQQYSRFYHVLDTLVGGVAEPIQVVRGATPKGLYPAARYMSPFCSSQQAPDAFNQFVATVREAGAHLLLSYSTTGGDSGNRRTISARDLIDLVSKLYGRRCVSVVDLAYGYRQFNHESRRTETSGTGEILIVGEAR